MTDDEKLRVLVVEDEAPIREGLCDLLAYHGYLPEPAADGEAGLAAARSTRRDLVLLDVMLPGLDGFEVCRRLRAEQRRLPILMLTAKGREDDVVEGLRAGADDYVTKPFATRELMARIAALMRRSGRLDRPPTVHLGPWVIDVEALEAADGEQRVRLSRREVELLEMLVRERGRVVSRRSLLAEVWDWNNVDEVETRTVDVHVARLRRKLGSTGEELIETVRGVGYRVPG